MDRFRGAPGSPKNLRQRPQIPLIGEVKPAGKCVDDPGSVQNARRSFLCRRVIFHICQLEDPLETKIAKGQAVRRYISAVAGVPVTALERRTMTGAAARKYAGSLQIREYPRHFSQADSVESGTDRIAFATGIDEEAVLGLQIVACEIKAFLRLRRQTALDF